MISNLFAVVAVVALIFISIFMVWSLKTQHLKLLHKLYMALAICYAVWVLALLIMKFVDANNSSVLFCLDAVTNSTGPLMPALYLCIALAFLGDWEKMPARAWGLFVVPLLSSIVVWTNPLHHLQYRVFSVIKSEIVFGPYSLVSGAYCYICILIAMFLMIRYALQNRIRMYVLQCIVFALGGVCPLIVSVASTFTSKLPITATPMSFMTTVILNGIAIYCLHIFDIKPMATQLVLDSISDAYLILSDGGRIVSFNRPFFQIFSPKYRVREGAFLKDFILEEDMGPGINNNSNTAIYDLTSAAESCRSSLSTIFYEQSIIVREKDAAVKRYFITEVSPVILKRRYAGCIVIFKDVTQLKNSMQELQESQTRMMEQERLAFLGQMIGGLAHNLKTPIMSISGCASSVEALVEECRESLGDEEVTEQDYREILGEMEEWLKKIHESSSYMSEVITAIKGQATTVVTGAEAEFTIDELFKRVTLLMRHELYTSKNTLTIEYGGERGTLIRGDINGLIQVLDNFISNATYAQYGKGKIVLGVTREQEYLKIYVKDNGPGVSSQVKGRLFREMVTSKGMRGTGLGLYISQAIVHGNFGGNLWYEDNPEGGAIFGMSIPLERIATKEGKFGGLQNEKKEAGIRTE